MSSPTPSREQPPASVINAGDIIDGKYLVGECIAWGGMGIVTDAMHLHLQKPVALKCIRAEFLENEEMVKRFLNEARIAANLRNEHVARVLDFGKTEAGIAYLVMERLEGMSLAASVKDRGQLPVAEAADYVLQACEAVAEAHAQGIVHRDIKPENLFLTQGVNGTPIVKVLDFGISKQLSLNVGRTLTNPSSSLGSPCYMSPEQMRNARLVDRRTDIWSMGAVLFELLAAQPPFDGDSLPEICAHVMCDAPRPLRDLRPGLPRGLEAVISRCLQKDRDKRFADVAEFARALSKYASPEGRASIPSIDHITSNSEAPVSAERRRPVVDSVAGFAPTVLAPLSAAWSEEPARDDETEARSVKIPGVRSRWGWVIGCALLLVATGVGMARYLGRDIFRPMRGVILPASLREDAIEVLPARPALELPSRFDRGPARAVREPEALTLSVTDGVVSPSPAPTLPAFEPGHANTAAEPVAQPSNDDPYAAPPPSL